MAMTHRNPPPFCAVSLWHFVLGAMSVAWGRYQQIYMHSLGFSPSYIGLLTALGLVTKVVTYGLWSLGMDLFGGSALVLAASVAVSALGLEVFRLAAEHGSLALVLGTKILRSAANAQYTLLDALTMRSVEPTFGLKSDSDDDAPECVAKDDMPDLPLPTHTKLLVRDSDADSAAPPLASSFYSYGSARVWGSVGWAAASPLVGVWMDRSGVNVVFAWTYAWSVVFVVLILMQPALCPTANYLVTATKDHRAPKRAPRLPQLLAAFKAFLLATETRNFLLHYMCFFFVLNIYDSVFWLHLEHSAAPSKAMIGWATSLQTVIELPVFLWADHLKRIFGVRVLLATARAALVARLLLSLFVAPGYGWVVLPVQALHGASFGLYKSISVDEAHRLAPPSLQASAQGAVAVAGVLVGSAGSILWAAVYERHGSKMVYLGGAFLEVLGTALFLNQQQK